MSFSEIKSAAGARGKEQVGLTSNAWQIWKAGALSLILACACIFGWKAFSYWQTQRQNVRLLLLSGRPESLDLNLKTLSSPGSGITYARQDSSFGKGLLQNLGVENPPKLVLVKDNSGEIEVERNPSIIAALLEARTSNSSAAPLPILAGMLCGMWIGALFPRQTRHLIPILFGIGVLALGWKWTHACATCPTEVLFGIDLDFLGLAVFAGLLTMACMLPKSSISTLLVAYLCLGVGSVQAWLVATSAMQLCVPCSIAAAVTFSVIVACLSQSEALVRIEAPKYRWATFLAPLGALVLFSLDKPGTESVDLSGKTTAPRLWIGKNISELGIAFDERAKGALICIGQSTCEPCLVAHAFLQSQVDIPYIYFELSRNSGSTIGKRSVKLKPGVLALTPTFFTVGPDGSILAESSGWVDDTLFKDAFLYEVRRTLALVDRRIK